MMKPLCVGVGVAGGVDNEMTGHEGDGLDNERDNGEEEWGEVVCGVRPDLPEACRSMEAGGD